MSAKISEFSIPNSHKEKGGSLDIWAVANRYLYHWPLFVTFLTVSLALAYVYLQLAVPVYQVRASVIINDEKKEPDSKSQLQEIDVYGTSKLAENELEVFQSRRLIEQVVNDLQLQVSYYQKHGFRSVDVYTNSPILFQTIKAAKKDTIAVLKIKLNDSKSFFLKGTDLRYKKYFFNDILSSKMGSWKLSLRKGIDFKAGTEFTVVINPVSLAAANYQSLITTEQPNKLVPVIELSLKDKNEQRSKDVINRLINLYNLNNVAEKNRLTENTLAFINNRISSLSGDLRSSENAVQNFRSDEGIADISSQSKIYLENAQSNDNKLNEINVQLSIIGAVEKLLNSPQNIQSASASLGSTYPNLNSLIEKLSLLQLQHDRMLTNTPESNPAFEPVNGQISSTKAEIKANIQSIKVSLQSVKEKLERYNSSYESSIKNVPVQERALVSKTREQTIRENLYNYLLQKREEVALNYAAILPDARIVDYAYSGPAKSVALFVYLGAVLFGLCLPAAIIYSRLNLNSRIMHADEIESQLQIDIFSEISKDIASDGIINFRDAGTAISEQFRDLRTNLVYQNINAENGVVTLVTSSIANEGKSFISSNLGSSLALSGKKTVILEMDFRKPQVIDSFKLLKQHKGLIDYLNGEAKVDEIVQKSGVYDNLDLIGCGAIPNNPSELFERKEMDLLFTYLRGVYQQIIVDSPPVNLVTDAKLISKYCDITLYIIRQAFTYKSLLKFINSLYLKGQLKNIQIVFNGIENGRYGYGNHYENDYYHVPNLDSKRALKIRMKKFLTRF